MSKTEIFAANGTLISRKWYDDNGTEITEAQATTQNANAALIKAALTQAILDMATIGTDMAALVASAAVPAGAALSTTQLTTVVRALDSAARTLAADLASAALRLKQAARLLNGDFSSSV